MRINDAGLKLLKEFEGCKLEAYQDLVGVWTIGYGHTGEDVSPYWQITQEEADELLRKDLEKFERGVEKLLKVPVTSNEFSALVCFAYNVGLGNLKQSTLLNCINLHNKRQAPNEFLRWNKAGGIPVKGLTRRREAERLLFLSS